jgi:hypothetical protein
MGGVENAQVSGSCPVFAKTPDLDDNLYTTAGRVLAAG